MNKTTYQQVVEEQMKEFDEKFTFGGRVGVVALKTDNAMEIKSFLRSFASSIAEAVRGEDMESWIKATEILYCEHCGKFVNDKQRTELHTKLTALWGKENNMKKNELDYICQHHFEYVLTENVPVGTGTAFKSIDIVICKKCGETRRVLKKEG